MRGMTLVHELINTWVAAWLLSLSLSSFFYFTCQPHHVTLGVEERAKDGIPIARCNWVKHHETEEREKISRVISDQSSRPPNQCDERERERETLARSICDSAVRMWMGQPLSRQTGAAFLPFLNFGETENASVRKWVNKWTHTQTRWVTQMHPQSVSQCDSGNNSEKSTCDEKRASLFRSLSLFLLCPLKLFPCWFLCTCHLDLSVKFNCDSWRVKWKIFFSSCHWSDNGEWISRRLNSFVTIHLSVSVLNC